MKITFMGAGSSVFARNVLGDCMCSEALRDSIFQHFCGGFATGITSQGTQIHGLSSLVHHLCQPVLKQGIEVGDHLGQGGLGLPCSGIQLLGLQLLFPAQLLNFCHGLALSAVKFLGGQLHGLPTVFHCLKHLRAYAMEGI